MTANGKFNVIGAWTGMNCLNNPTRAITLAKNANINHLDIMINDGSKGGLTSFHIYKNKDVILKVVKQLQDAGLTVSFTTWVLPNEEWINGIKNVIVPLCNEANVTELCFDLEEAWITPQKNSKDLPTVIKRAYWSQLLQNATKWSGLLCKTSVTNIVYTNFEVLNPVLSWVDRIIPQCYSTVLNTKTSKPGHLEQVTFDIYMHYGSSDVLGMAGWNLEGSYGLHANDALYCSLNKAIDLGYKEVRFWRLDFLTGKFAEILKEF